MSFLREPNAEPIPGYRLIEPLGSGGFGEVWKCEAPGGLYKAIKFVYGNLNSLDVDGVRAEQELKALQRIKEVRHPFVCSMDRIEVVDGELVIVMELADKSLFDLYQECQAAGMIGIPRDDLLRFVRDAAEALDLMNEKHGLQHLDVKPRNLFLICDRVKVADFGLVKHLERQSASGLLGGVTPLYAAPETFNGKVSERSDQYSLAIVYMELLTGQRPFNGKNVRVLAQQHLQEEPELRALPEGERQVIGRALAKDPAKRYPSCMALVRALFAARNPVPARADAPALQAATVVTTKRPKTITDTMEDFQLNYLPESHAEDVHGLDVVPVDPDSLAEVSQLGITIAQPQTGALRPTVIIGVGAFGRQAVLELRCRFLDRFGSLAKVPLLRFLCIDTDPEATRNALRGAPEVALLRSEMHHLPLQPVGNYRRRSLDQLGEWLPREKLYAMPRSLQTQGTRALGRLAFADNHQRLLARLRREIQQATHPDTLYQSVNQTSLALRDNVPRVYVIAAAGGGGGGMLTDLGFALRRLLQQLRHNESEVTCFLMCGAPEDPATPRTELGNVYATLTELNHYNDPAIPFVAEYSADGQRIVDQGKPFGSVYLLGLGHRSPQVLQDTLSHLGSYLFHELTTPLGMRLEQLRMEEGPRAETPFRSLGTYAVWFPRGLLLRVAARQACRLLIDDWLAPADLTTNPQVLGQLQTMGPRVLGDPRLEPEALAARILKEVEKGKRDKDDFGHGPAPTFALYQSSPSAELTGLLSNLEEQSQQTIAQEDPGLWARQAVNRVREYVGAGGEQSVDLGDARKNRLRRQLSGAAQKVAEEYEQELTRSVFAMMEHAGTRLARAEAAMKKVMGECQALGQKLTEPLARHVGHSQQSWRHLEAAVEDCLSGAGGGFRLFGGRSARRLMRDFMDRLIAFARQRLAEEMTAACYHFFVLLLARLTDRANDLGFCRQRLRQLQENLSAPAAEPEDLTTTRAGTDLTVSRTPLTGGESYWKALRQSTTARVVLPDGEEDLERAAITLLRGIKADQWRQFDEVVHETVLAPLGGMHSACLGSADASRLLVGPLLDQVANCLGGHLPIMDVAQAEFAARTPVADGGLVAQTRAYLDRAAPLLARKDGAQQHAFLLVPASDAGKALGEEARVEVEALKLVKVPGQADLMFCREQGGLRAADLGGLLSACRPAYEALCESPTTSPHARFDVTDWVPLDP